MTVKKEYQNVFKNIFEYHTKGMLNDKEFGELMDLIYYFRWENDKYDTSSVSDKVKLVWQGIEPTFSKSKTNSINGNKGGAPKGNQNARKKKPSDELMDDLSCGKFEIEDD